jgi:acyl-coenzyme A thioesterase PaaI-like protein
MEARMDEGRALQDIVKVHCFGCGALNEQGLQIKSHLVGDEVVCRWQPLPHHIGYPGIVYGGTIASIIDCHAIWTAGAIMCRDRGVPLDQGHPYVTGKLSISYLKPAKIDAPLELRARVTDKTERRVNVACSVRQGDVEVATAEVVTVRIA